jgi:hypothetical protein
MKESKIPTKAKMLTWWLIVLSLLEMFFGISSVFNTINFSGDYMVAALYLFLIAVLGLLCLIFAIFLMSRKMWTLTAIKWILGIIIVLQGYDFLKWLLERDFSYFLQFFSKPNPLEVLLSLIILAVPTVTLLIIVFFKKQSFLTPGSSTK